MGFLGDKLLKEQEIIIMVSEEIFLENLQFSEYFDIQKSDVSWTYEYKWGNIAYKRIWRLFLEQSKQGRNL